FSRRRPRRRALRRPLSDRDAVSILQVLLPFDLLLNLEEPFEQRFGPGWAAGDIDVDGDDLVDPFANRIRVLKEADAIGAAPHRNDVTRLRHLVVKTLHPERHLVRQGAGHDDEIAGPRARARRGAETLEIGARATGLHELDGTAGQSEEQIPNTVGAPPIE